MSTSERQAIIVVGMHRSGTSAITRAINLLGAELPKGLLGANVGNKQGHWESEELIALHEEMLASAGSRWSSIHDIAPSWFQSGEAAEFAGRIAGFIEREFPKSASFVVKDPRIAVFIPVWKAALVRLGLRGRFVIPYRNPLEVAASLATRDDPDASENVWHERGLLLWLRYVLAAERSTRGDLRSFVDFDSLLSNWQAEMARIGDQIKVEWPLHDPAVAQSIAGFLDKGHKNQSYADALADLRETAPWVHGAFAALEHCVTAPSAEAATFDAVGAAWTTGASLLARYVGATEARTTAARHLSWELNDARSRIAQLEHDVRDLTSRLEAVPHGEAGHHGGAAEGSRSARGDDRAANVASALSRAKARTRHVLARAGVGRAIRFATGQRTYGISVIAGQDESLDVPIFEVERDYAARPGDRVCVVAHVFYGDLAPQIRRSLDNIPGPVDVFVSTCTDADKVAIEAAFGGWSNGDVVVAVVENKGRDISHKLVTFKDVYRSYEYVLFVHSKRSPHDASLASWRDYLLDNLVGSKEIAKTNLGLLAKYPWLGIVSPQHFAPLRPWIKWDDTFGAAGTLAMRMGFDLREAPLDFPSGSMFWARTAALAPLLDLRLTLDDFEAEAGQAGNTLAHAIEHLFFHACEHAGYGWIKVARAELLSGTPEFAKEQRNRTLRGYLMSRRRRRLLA